MKITEAQLQSIIKESIKKVLNEEIDMGQIPNVQDRRDNIKAITSQEELGRREINRLRHKLDNCTDPNEEAEICKQIKQIKKKLGY